MSIYDIKEERLGADCGLNYIKLTHEPTGISVEGDAEQKNELIKKLFERLENTSQR